MTKLTPLKAIRTKCLDCAESIREVAKCPITMCPLHVYRFGRNPARKGIGNASNFSKKTTQLGTLKKTRAGQAISKGRG